MDFIFKPRNEEPSDCSYTEQDLQKCPFLRNINKPTNFSFGSLNFPFPGKGARGPIFEDGTNFDLAFKVFHGKDGVVPLSQSSCGGPFSFDSFSEKWKKPKRNESSSKGDSSKHEAMGNEWLKTGNCPIAKSYRAASHVLPLVASVLKPPPGMKFKCPPAVVAARAALARTAFVKTLHPQPLSSKMLAIGVLGMAANIPLGIWREHTRKFSLSWFAAVHAAVPFIAMLRKSVVMPKTAMALTIAASILGQVIGSRAERIRMKAKAERGKMVACAGPAAIAGDNLIQADSNLGFLCGKQDMAWDPLPDKAVKNTSPPPSLSY